MSKTTSYLIIAIVIVLTLPVFFITIPLLIIMNNKLVSLKNKVEYSYSGIDVMLKKRFDLIPNLVSSVKTYMEHEAGLLTRITELRSQLIETNGDSSQRFNLENELSSLLSKVQINMENYPDLKSNENIMHLQKTLHEIEEQISAARRAYNLSVVKHNESIESIPLNIMAGVKSLKPATYFNTPKEEKANPNIGNLFG